MDTEGIGNALERDLRGLLSAGQVSSDPADRLAYARDLYPREQIATRRGVAAPHPPGLIVWPENVAEVQAVIRFAATRTIPLVPFGAGSGVCGGIRATPASIIVDVKRMRRIRAVDASLLTCDAEAGILGQAFEDELAARGFTLGHFPSSIYCSTLGGWLAARSAGQCSGRYGKIEDMVLALTCVDGSGEVQRLSRDGERADILPLVVGSEGILAVITDATLQIAPAPTERTFAAFSFDDEEAGLDAIREIYQTGLRPAVARLYDPLDTMMARRGARRAGQAKNVPKKSATSAEVGLGTRMLVRALRKPGGLNRLIEAVPSGWLGGALLVLVWEDAPALGHAERAEATRIVSALGGKNEGEEPARHWLKHRHAVSYRQSPMYAAGAFVDTMEVASTWSRLVPMYRAVRHALGPHVLVMAHFSHAYPDGASIYFTFAGAQKDDVRAEKTYDAAWKAALEAAIDAGGTLSHHHGVGRSKAPMMRREQGAAVDAVRALKERWDPAGILNPGSLLPAENAR